MFIKFSYIYLRKMYKFLVVVPRSSQQTIIHCRIWFANKMPDGCNGLERKICLVVFWEVSHFYVPLFPCNQPRPCLLIMQINEYTGNWAVSSSQSQRDMNQSCSVTAKSVWIVSRWLRRSQCWSLTDILPTKWTVTENL